MKLIFFEIIIKKNPHKCEDQSEKNKALLVYVNGCWGEGKKTSVAGSSSNWEKRR